jgi:hypothetical protein
LTQEDREFQTSLGYIAKPCLKKKKKRKKEHHRDGGQISLSAELTLGTGRRWGWQGESQEISTKALSSRAGVWGDTPEGSTEDCPYVDKI